MNKLFLLTLALSAGSNFFAKLSNYPEWGPLLDFKEIEHRLANETPVKINSINENHPTVKLVQFESGLQGVFKAGEYRFSERAAYKASLVLGLRLVPPTVMRTIDGKEGSLQFFIEDARALTSELENRIDKKQISNMRIFYYVFGQWDSHFQNQLISSVNGQHYVALIDNAGMLHRIQTRYGGELYIEKGEEDPAIFSSDSNSFPFDKAKKINTKSKEKMYDLFGSIIPDQLPNLTRRSQDLYYVFWRNTLWMKRYPLKTTHLFYQSTLDALEHLNEQVLRDVWSEWCAQDEQHANKLIELTLNRRDELLLFARTRGTIIDDCSISTCTDRAKKEVTVIFDSLIQEPIYWTLEQLFNSWN